MSDQKKQLQEKIQKMNLAQLTEFRTVAELVNRTINLAGILFLLICLYFPNVFVIIATAMFVPFLAILATESAQSLKMVQDRIQQLDK